jgi:Protein of unknown function (DUF3224)
MSLTGANRPDFWAPPVSKATLRGVANSAKGTFAIKMGPASADVDGHVDRVDFTKTFSGDIEATGSGVILSAGDPRAGEAGYVAIERVHGRVGDREGGFALQQFGTMHSGAQTLHYEVVPGSGEGGLEGISGTFHLTIDNDGTHRYELVYDL